MQAYPKARHGREAAARRRHASRRARRRRRTRAALDNIFNHPNVGPFIARRLIQQLVTSNPSPAYVERVAQRFNNDGRGSAAISLRSSRRCCSIPKRAAPPRDERQAQGAAAATHAALARLRRARRERQLRAAQSERSRPGAAARRRRCSISSVRSMHRPARSRPGPGRARDADRDGIPEHVAHELFYTPMRSTATPHAGPRTRRRRHRHRSRGGRCRRPRARRMRRRQAARRADLDDAAQRRCERSSSAIPRPTRRIARRKPSICRHVARVRGAAMSARDRCITTQSSRFLLRAGRRGGLAAARGRAAPIGQMVGSGARSPTTGRSSACSCSAATTPSTWSCRAAPPSTTLMPPRARISPSRKPTCCRSRRSIPTARSTACIPSMPGLRDLFEQEPRRSSRTSVRCSSRRQGAVSSEVGRAAAAALLAQRPAGPVARAARPHLEDPAGRAASPISFAPTSPTSSSRRTSRWPARRCFSPATTRCRTRWARPGRWRSRLRR